MDQTVTIYSLKDCKQCQEVKRLLQEKGIPYQECRDAAVMEALRIKQTPALRVSLGPTTYKTLTTFEEVMGWMANLK